MLALDSSGNLCQLEDCLDNLRMLILSSGNGGLGHSLVSFLSRNVFCPGVPLMQSRAFSFQYVFLFIILVGLFLYVNDLKLSEEK